jgi:hypothetical protein
MIVVTLANLGTKKAAKMAPNPDYDTWISRDQIVLTYLLQSLSYEVLPHVRQIEQASRV